MDIEKFLNEMNPEALKSGVFELQTEVFRIKRWVDSASITMRRINDMVDSTTDGEVKDLLQRVMGDFIEVGLLLNTVAERDTQMATAGEEASTRIEASRMTMEMQEFLNSLNNGENDG